MQQGSVLNQEEKTSIGLVTGEKLMPVDLSKTVEDDTLYTVYFCS